MMKLIAYTIGVYIISVMVHEYGHYCYFAENISKEVKIKFCKVVGKASRTKLTPLAKFEFYLAGVTSGLLFILGGGLPLQGVNMVIYYAMTIPSYMIGCHSDLKKMSASIREGDIFGKKQ